MSFAVVTGHHLAVVGGALGGGGDDRRRLPQVAGALRAGDDERDPAVTFLATIQQSQYGFDDPAGILVVLQRDRALIEPRVGVPRRVCAVDDGNSAEVLVGHSVRRHVALGVQRDPGCGSEQSERRVVRHERRSLRAGASAAAETEPGPLVERAVAHHHIGDAGRDGHRRVHHRAGRRTAAVRHARKERQVADAHATRHVDLVAGVHGEGDHAVDIARCQAGVVECGTDCLTGQLQLAAPGFLGELGLADSRQ